MPDPVQPVAPAATTPPVVTPPAVPAPTVQDDLGNRYNPYMGGERDPFLDTPLEGDRGDDIAPPPAPAPVPEPVPEPVPPNPVAEDPPADPPPPADPEDTEPLRDPATGQFIPRSRFNEVNNKLKTLQAELDALKAQRPSDPAPTPAPTPEPAPPAFDFDAAEEAYMQLVLDGKTAEAVAKRKEIRAAEQAQFTEVAARTTNEVTTQQRLDNGIETVANRYIGLHEQLNPESEQFSQELMDDIQIVYTGTLQSGNFTDPIEAWEKSIQKALRMHGIDPSGKKTPPPEPTPPPVPPKPAGTPEKRTAATQATPPNPTATGANGVPASVMQIDVSTLTAEDFAKLPPATQARLRGDIIE